MTMFLNSGFERIAGRAPASSFGLVGVFGGFGGRGAGLGRFCCGCAVTAGPDGAPVAEDPGPREGAAGVGRLQTAMVVVSVS